MTNGVSQVLGVIQRDVLGLQHAINMTVGSFDRAKVAAVGFAGVFAGGAILGGLYKLSRHADDYLHQLEQMRAMGLSVAEQNEAIRAANVTSHDVMTTTPAGNLEAIRELRGALNSAGASPAAATKEAIEYLSTVERAAAVMQNTVGGRAAGGKGGVFEMVKALEDIGATTDPKRFEGLLEGMVRASEAFGGKITGRDWFQTLRYTRGAGRGYSDEFLTKYLPTLMQEMKAGAGSGAGGGAGNPLASLFQIAVAGKGLDRAALGEWNRLGLIQPGALHADHGRLSVKPGGVTNSEEAVRNPYFWVRDTLLPALQRAGIQQGTPRFTQEIAVMFGNRVAQQMVGLLTQVNKMEGDRRLVEGTMPPRAAFDELQRRDPIMARQAAEAQLSRAMTDLGKNRVVTAMMYNLGRALDYVSGVFERHPVRTQYIVGFAAGLGALLAVLGTVAIGAAGIAAIGAAFTAVGASAAIAGPIGLGIAASVAAVSAAIAAFYLIPWDRFGAWAQGMWAAASDWAATAGSLMGRDISRTWQSVVQAAGEGARWVAEIVASFKSDFLGVWAGITEGLQAFIARIREFVANISGALGGIVGKAAAMPSGNAAWQAGGGTVIDVGGPSPAGGGPQPAGVTGARVNLHSSPAWSAPGASGSVGAEIGSATASAITGQLSAPELGSTIGDKTAAAVRTGLTGMTINLDGQAVGRVLATRGDAAARQPPSTSTIPDVRLGALRPAEAY